MSDATWRDRETGGQFAGFWLYYLLYAAVVIRTFVYSLGESSFAPLPYGLMGGFLLLGLVQPLLSRRFPAFTHSYLGAQTVLVFVLLLTRPLHDFYATLYMSLALTVTLWMPLGRDILWLGIFCATLTAGLLLGFGWPEGMLYVPSFLAGVIFVGLYGRANRKAVEARARSEELREKLEEANRRLRVYAERAEEAATAQERARLARELHDAVTQTVFSMNLTAQAARMGLERDPGKVPALLDRLQDLARDALGETRSMVEELRPRSVADAGLVRSLERHVALREKRDGLRVTLQVKGEEAGSASMKDALFRTAQEALNNVFRHSGTTDAVMSLCFNAKGATLVVRDQGRGFDATAVRPAESFGLITMRERVEAQGGRFRLASTPGKGTEIEVNVPIGREPANEEKGE